MVEEKIDEDAGKENRPPQDDENVYELPAFEDDFLTEGLFFDRVKGLRIRNVC